MSHTALANRILIIGNHTCGNRGDAAILRGLIAGLLAENPKADITTTSRFPVSSSYLLGRPVRPDLMAGWELGTRFSRPGYFTRRLLAEFIPLLMALAVAFPLARRWLVLLLPTSIRKRIEQVRDYDVAIQVGGSFFVDLYGYRQFETPFCVVLAGKPLVLLGHSLGPFGGRRYRFFASALLRRAQHVALREQVSRTLIEQAGLPMEKLVDGSDTAWLVSGEPAPAWIAEKVQALTSGRPAIAITMRDLAPFDQRLGITQIEFEKGFAQFADKLIEQGYDVIACSTCTGIESYNRDDRMVALRARDKVSHPDRFHVLMEELNDIELGQFFSQCQLVVGTRLHSAIIAMNFGTPAVALNYEHKSAGIMEQLALPSLALPVQALLDGRLLAQVEALLADLPSIRAELSSAVARQRFIAAAMITNAIGGAQSHTLKADFSAPSEIHIQSAGLPRSSGSAR